MTEKSEKKKKERERLSGEGGGDSIQPAEALTQRGKSSKRKPLTPTG